MPTVLSNPKIGNGFKIVRATTSNSIDIRQHFGAVNVAFHGDGYGTSIFGGLCGTPPAVAAIGTERTIRERAWTGFIWADE